MFVKCEKNKSTKAAQMDDRGSASCRCWSNIVYCYIANKQRLFQLVATIEEVLLPPYITSIRTRSKR